MNERYEELTINQKMKMLIQEMVDKRLQLKDALHEFEKIYIKTASSKFNGNKTKTAEALGLHRNTLHNRVKAIEGK